MSSFTQMPESHAVLYELLNTRVYSPHWEQIFSLITYQAASTLHNLIEICDLLYILEIYS